MDENTNTSSFRSELEDKATQIQGEQFMKPGAQRKKIIFWLLRTGIAISFYLIFWEYNWVKWSLLVYIPISLFSLLSITLWPYLIKRKLNKAFQKVSEAEKAIKDFDDQ